MNIKKLFSQEKFNKKKFIEFFDKKGFYIVLALCVVVVIATATFVTTRNISSTRDFDDKLASQTKDSKTTLDASAKVAAQTASSSIQKDATTDKNDNSLAKNDTKINTEATGNTQTKVAEAPKATPQASQPKAVVPTFVLPVYGQVTFDFSKEKLAYSKTLDQWMTHDGVDIASNLGEKVKCVTDGVVTDIKKDPRFGTTIIIEHADGLKSVYSNLADEEMVTVNQKVKQGDVIGSVGTTALFESAEAPHLHFEIRKNNVAIDPKTYLPKK